MRAFSLTLIALTVASCLQFAAHSDCQAQEIIKHLGERHGKPKTNYRPDDPWKRGKVFNLQTGHAGLFYNCDNEECKRNSPYICWKEDYEKMFPTPLGLIGRIKRDCERVKQRVRDGAGACARDRNCQECADTGSCVAKSTTPPLKSIEPGSYLKKLDKDFWQMADKVVTPEFEAPQVADTPRYGLVRGTMTQVESQSDSQVAESGTAADTTAQAIAATPKSQAANRRPEAKSPAQRSAKLKDGIDQFFRKLKR